ncbi:MAG: hypothetical protein A2184_01080 [Candidatus Moranbacteria bacterium RIFOXYA1_FULL_44_7]|nr:MAG: hypothetical protein A2184_01080 [Candidatus Moranbacteria bacterium RIFOXYA1_FULL_44_7]OGZ28568.1 MAG: hypothetical protein A2562_04240 [Candidatus Nealsonbacteria bacterium RIFOXYD1_FULL_39_11]
MENKVLMIAVPNMGTIKTETFISLFSAAYTLNIPAKLHVQTGCYIHEARNKAVNSALKSGVSHLLFVDADVQFDMHGINQLFEDDKDIVGGLYYRRQPPHHPTINFREGDKLVIPDKFPRDSVFEVFAIATGFMLINMKVFKKIEPPWFYFGNFHGKPMGEDVYFCWKAQKAGFKVYCDPRIKIGHVGDYVYDEKDYDAYIPKNEKKKIESQFDGQL